ncbi:hypothetical protein MLD38_025550 [Melastoma candidum]|uniref:Uncharacterized protein n=1 Tax=Melastoma candidum TaxID=119954 RepID=A0ACB9P0W1_9MYRT|nr:hypothetical protein MLD38_025550 [Melastoma candidum]
MEDAQQLVWRGAIPLQIHLHESEVTTLPPPPPVHILAPRIGYLPLLVPQIKPHFDNALPPGVDTVWFDYKGLPLKWFIPTGVLFDLLCPEPERPWNLTVHFRGYPANLLLPWEGEDSIKWSFINDLKEAAYIINGNCKSVMNMSQADQHDLWHSVLNGDLETYLLVSTKLRLGMEEGHTVNLDSMSRKQENEISGQVKSGKIPIRLYVRCVTENFDDLDEVPRLDNWDRLHYINQPVEILQEEGKYFSMEDAIGTLLPEVFVKNTVSEEVADGAEGEEQKEAGKDSRRREPRVCLGGAAELKLLRVQGIEPQLDIPFSWVASNLVHPERFLHVCALIRADRENTA